MGIARSARAPHDEAFGRWLDEGRHGTMEYLEATRSVRRDPEGLLPGVRSIVVLASPYPAADPRAGDGTKTARYALSTDYHRTLRESCESLVRDWRERERIRFRHRVCVDSAPLAERAFAAAAGIGWIGKNGMVLNEEGSYFLLCEILIDLELAPDSPVTERCGSCTKCLDACPTSAFLRPGVLDATRCLSYWTIEQRGAIPDEIVDRIGPWVFGCDVCQEVCPYNRAVETGGFERQPAGLSELLEIRSGQWRRRFGDTPLARAGLSGMRRNAAAAAAGASRTDLLPALRAHSKAANPTVSMQSRSALRRLGAGAA